MEIIPSFVTIQSRKNTKSQNEYFDSNINFLKSWEVIYEKFKFNSMFVGAGWFPPNHGWTLNEDKNEVFKFGGTGVTNFAEYPLFKVTLAYVTSNSMTCSSIQLMILDASGKILVPFTLKYGATWNF